MATTKSKGRIHVTFDQTDADTPVMIHTKNWSHTATYWCGREVGELDGGNKTNIELTEAELEWLDSLEDQAAACEEIARKDRA